jgi:hypothetical protein
LSGKKVLDQDRVPGQLATRNHEGLTVGCEFVPEQPAIVEVCEPLQGAAVERESVEVGAVPSSGIRDQ